MHRPPCRRLHARITLSAALLAGAVGIARADDAATTVNPAPPANGSGAFGFLTGIDRSSNLLGSMWGLRPALGAAGITFNLNEVSEYLGNVTGGTRKGFDYDGLTTMSLQLDTERAFGLPGGTFNVSALQIHGRNLSADNLATLQTASGIEADRATRLWELWYDQKFLEDDRADIKLGQQSLDQEFMVSQNALLFVNTMFGWPMLPSADLPGGGPAYPLSAPGVRGRLHVTDEVTLLAGVFNGSPDRHNAADPQRENPSGTIFPVNGGMLAIAELQYAYPSPNTLLTPDEGEPLARTYKVGVWYDTEAFADVRTGTDGLSLASPGSNGIPLQHRGDYAVYAVADQMLWRQADEPDRNLNAFLRAMGTPLADRNLISFSLNAGLTMHEPFPHRDDDTFGIGMGYTRVSGDITALDRAANALNGTAGPVRTSETFVEATYQYEVTPWLQLQPDVQYVFNPGAGVADPSIPTKRLGDELVVGLRTTITF